MAVAGSVQLCLAGAVVHEPGGQMGWYGTFPWLAELTFYDSKAQKTLWELGKSWSWPL